MSFNYIFTNYCMVRVFEDFFIKNLKQYSIKIQEKQDIKNGTKILIYTN